MSKKVYAFYFIIFTYLIFLFSYSSLLTPYQGEPISKLANGFYKIQGFGCVHKRVFYSFLESLPEEVHFSQDAFVEWFLFDEIEERILSVKDKEVIITYGTKQCIFNSYGRIEKNDTGELVLKLTSKYHAQMKNVLECKLSQEYKGKHYSEKYDIEEKMEMKEDRESFTEATKFRLYRDKKSAEIILYNEKVTDLTDRGCDKYDSELIKLSSIKEFSI